MKDKYLISQEFRNKMHSKLTGEIISSNVVINLIADTVQELSGQVIDHVTDENKDQYTKYMESMTKLNKSLTDSINKIHEEVLINHACPVCKKQLE